MAKKKAHEPISVELPAEIAEQAETERFTGNDLLAVAARAVMAQHTKKLYDHLPGVLTGDDPHDIHQMRVATRRLRASLQATAVAFQPEPVDSLRRHLRRIARALGEVRDRDVLLMRLRKDAKRMAGGASADDPLVTNPHDELQEAIGQLQDERNNAHAELVEALGSKRTRKLLAELTQFLVCPLEDVQADDELPLLVHHHVGSALWHEYEAVRRFETVMHDASSEQLHNLRIACKYLRYTLELFEPALGSEARGTLKLVTAMQEHLGNIHDADVAIEYLNAAREEHPTTPTAANRANGASPDEQMEQQPMSRIAEYIERRIGERSELAAGVQPLWQQLVAQSTRQMLARMITEL